MTGLDFAGGEELSSAFEPCLCKLFFWRELFGMRIFPPVPESRDDLLEHASHRDREKPPEQAEEFCAGEERENGHDGMNSHGTAENAWCEDHSHHNPQEQHP